MSRYKNILFLVAVLIAQVIGLASQIRRANPSGSDTPSVRLIRYWGISLVSPPEKVVHGSGSGIRHLWSNYIDLRNVREQNKDLKEQLGRLQLEQASLQQDARQGQRLQALLAFKEHYIYSTVAAQVIGTAGTDQSRILYIDKGAKDGLRPDMAVITPDGIVGKLREVYAHTSQVLVISDQSSGAGVLLESTRLRGVLRGNALGQPQIINLLPDERVKPGDRVVTSGGDQIFPRGLPVGTVEEVIEDASNPPYVDILIKPAANLGHLEELLVITQVAEEMPDKAKRDLAQSAVVGELAATQQRASDILAERLPGLTDPTALADSNQVLKVLENPDAVGVKLHPPPALHPDHFSPDSTRPAKALTPGQAVVDQKYAPTPASTPPPAAAKTAVEGKTAEGKASEGKASEGKTSEGKTAEGKTAEGKTSAAKAAGAAGTSAGTAGTAAPPVAKPKVVKPKPAAPAVDGEPVTTSPAPPGNGAPPQ